MAKRSQDLAAAKAKKQKIILIVGGVLLLAVAASSGAEAAQGQRVDLHTGGHRLVERDRCGADSDRRRRATAPRGAAMVAGVALPKVAVVKVSPEPARLVHALRGQGSLRAGGRRHAHPDADRAGCVAKRKRDGRLRQPRRPVTPSGSTPATTGTTPAAPPPPIAYATHQLRRQAAAGAGEGQVPGRTPRSSSSARLRRSRSRSALPAAPSTTARPSRSRRARR